jgi:hypothetical protein
MTKAEEYFLKLEWRMKQDALDANDKDPVAKAAKAAREAEEEAAREAKRKEPRIVVSNADNAALMPKSIGGAVLGHVEEVNGEEGREVTGFIPTRHELKQIVKFWYDELSYLHQKRVDFGVLGSSEYRTMAFGIKRIERARTVLAEEGVDKAMQEVDDRNEARKEHEVRQQDIAVLRALAAKVEHAEHGMYDRAPEVRYTFADGSVLVAHEGYYGKTSFNVAHWFSTTAEKEAFDAEMAERNVVRWDFRKRGSGHMVRRPEKPAAAAPPELLLPTGDKPLAAAAPTGKESQPV